MFTNSGHFYLYTRFSNHSHPLSSTFLDFKTSNLLAIRTADLNSYPLSSNYNSSSSSLSFNSSSDDPDSHLSNNYNLRMFVYSSYKKLTNFTTFSTISASPSTHSPPRRPFHSIRRPGQTSRRPFPSIRRPDPTTRRPFPSIRRPHPTTRRPVPSIRTPDPTTRRPFPSIRRPGASIINTSNKKFKTIWRKISYVQINASTWVRKRQT